MNGHRFWLVLALASWLFIAPTAGLAQKSQPQTNQSSTTDIRPTVSTPNGLVTDEFQLVRPTSQTKPVLSSSIQLSTDIPKTDALVPLEPAIGGRLGILIETLDGKTVRDVASEELYNPASNVKLLTALVALKNFGHDYRFTTAVWTNGTFDAATGTINGDLIISGRDPSFHYEHAVELAQELNKQGIRVVTGDLIVPYGFTMNFDWSALRSGEKLYDTLDSTRRPAVAASAWYQQRVSMGDTASLQTTPSVAVMGAVYVDAVPAQARVILMHKSPKLIDILKVLLCYSNNFMAERIGESIGGPGGIKRALVDKFGLDENEVFLATTSGLGTNRVTPRAMMKALKILRAQLSLSGHTFSDIMPVAGIDPGTLEKRFTATNSRGSVIGKTGTLGRTDGGVSSLAGLMRTASGETLIFVIFNMKGSASRFRNYQDSLITFVQNERGGPAPFIYTPQSFAVRLSDTQLDPTNKLGDEYEDPKQ
jgi:D-alanyl-D-alanine carboxypeptidase/D-alanyl-D-alanine-endopeptidase (penicillin-binding protein 4)